MTQSSSQEVMFTAYNNKRDITYTLIDGSPETYGWQHTLKRHPDMIGKMHVLKKTVQETDIAIKDKMHPERERLYCYGADNDKPQFYITAVVQYESEKCATIFTAWHTDQVVEGDIVYVKA